MAIVQNGNTLEIPVIQPGWTVVSDGFGLNTSVTVYKCDHTVDLQPFLVKGTAHPDTAYAYLKIDKWRISWDSLGIATVTVDYCGIEPGVGEAAATITKANISSANGLTSEPITSHPSFFVAAAGYAGAIAGPGPYAQSGTGPIVQSKSPPFTPQRSFMGSSGACFESSNGGRFIGFVDPSFPSLYGKTNYLATTTSYSGIIYTSNLTHVQALTALLNSATSTRNWGTTFKLLPDWAPQGTVVGVGHKNLLSQVNVEEFGALYKINYEIRYAKNGWDAFVYTNIAAT